MHNLSVSCLEDKSTTWNQTIRSAIDAWLNASSDYAMHAKNVRPFLREIFDNVDTEPFTALPLFLLVLFKNEMPQLLKVWSKYDGVAPLEGKLNAIKLSLLTVSHIRNEISLSQMHKIVHFWINRLPSESMYAMDLNIRNIWVECEIILADMAQYCEKAVTTDGYGPAPKKWAHNAGKALNTMDISISNKHILAIFESSLTLKTKRRLAKHLHPQTWLHPDVYLLLEPLLSKHVQERYQALPWHNCAPEINKDLTLLYSPEIGVFLESLGGENIWADRSRILDMIKNSALPILDIENTLFELPLSF